ncbi:MAG TPA: hypothetical protein VFS47_02940 [Steroidobacteraceae bacterium]|nr:hypothetical protein [Steroidobacteraceae bacterium]
MSRSHLAIATGLLLASTTVLAGNENYGGMDPTGSLANAGVADATMIDMSQSKESDPAVVDMLFKEGNTIASILDGLKEKGFPIAYKKKNLPPTVTLVALPKGTRIDEVLKEILEPWNMDVYHSPTGKWIVRPNKTKAAELAATP